MKINEILAKISIAIIVFFVIRIMLIYFDFDFLATITSVIDFSGFSFVVYSIVITSFIVSFIYLLKSKTAKNFRIFLVSCACLGTLITIILGILVIYATSVDNF